jgi:N-acetyl sugar amidotransferase
MNTTLQTCARCLYTSLHPLGLTFDEHGICSGCRIHEEKNQLNWTDRWESLKRLVKPYRSNNPFCYDCIVPVTGAYDSYFIVHTVKNRLKLNPLLVTYNKYFNTPLGIRNLANLRIKFNCDILIQNVNPSSVRQITKTTLRKLGSIYWPCLAGQSVFPVQTAVSYKVPLIIWGAHQGLEQVGMFSHEHEVEMTRRYRKDHDLMGYEADDLLSIFDTIDEGHIWQYRYPDDSALNAVGVRGIYLGNYIRWDPKAQHEQMIRDYQYKSASFARTFDCYDHTDCFNYMDLHDLLKLYKHGYSKVTDHATREIRHGRLTREQGLSLVQKHQTRTIEYSHLFRRWLGLSRDGLDFILDQHRNLNYWHEDKPGKWSFLGINHKPQSYISNVFVEPPSTCHFVANSRLADPTNLSYITIGKGYP